MSNKLDNKTNKDWIEGDMRLAGLDSRMISLLRAVAQSGSINKAAKQLGLSYKGAWQIIERANNGSSKVLMITATGGSKGGGTRLTEEGHALLQQFAHFEQQHRQFLEQLNRNLVENPDLRLESQIIKTTVTNPLFGHIIEITLGQVQAEVVVELKGGSQVAATISLAVFSRLGLAIGTDVTLSIDSADIIIAVEANPDQLSARNCLSGNVVQVQQKEMNAEVVILLQSGERMTAMITSPSLQKLALVPGKPVWAIFKANAPILGIMP